MVTACIEAVDDRDVCKGLWPVCEDKVNLAHLNGYKRTQTRMQEYQNYAIDNE